LLQASISLEFGALSCGFCSQSSALGAYEAFQRELLYFGVRASGVLKLISIWPGGAMRIHYKHRRCEASAAAVVQIKINK